MNKKISDKLSVLTTSPGVYIMKNADNEIIYVGKAKNLKNRVSSYFISNSSHTIKVMKMVSNVDDFEYIVTPSELEALILENNLIKEHKPKYNILLKDDKTYPYISLDKKSPYPKFSLARRRTDNNLRYFGPFKSSSSVWEIIRTVNDVFGLYNCKHKFPADFGKFRPCLNYHIGKCPGICKGDVSQADYQKSIDQAVSFLSGDYKQLLSQLTKQMQDHSENLEFEKAALVRDRINSIKRLESKQIIVTSPSINRDIIAYSELDSDICFSVMHIRGGKLIFQDTQFLTDTDEDIMGLFIERYYQQKDIIPKDIAVSVLPKSAGLLSDWLSKERGSRVKIFEAQKGEILKLVEMCRKNASEKLAEKKANGVRSNKLMLQIAQMLSLPSAPSRFEMYDVSNFGSDSIVGGMIVWENGRFKKSDYKKFKFDDAVAPDDYRYTYEMIERRLKRLDLQSEGFEKAPDVIFLDGGLGHLNAVLPLFENRGIKVFGLVKDRKHRTRAIVSEFGEVDIRTNPPVYKFFTLLQDEVHRFAITYMKNKKNTAMLDSELMSIDGLGKERYKRLIDKFKTVDRIKNASVEEISSVKGMPLQLAKRIYAHFNEE